LDSFKEIREPRKKRGQEKGKAILSLSNSNLYWPIKSPTSLLLSKNIARTTFSPQSRPHSSPTSTGSSPE